MTTLRDVISSFKARPYLSNEARHLVVVARQRVMLSYTNDELKQDMSGVNLSILRRKLAHQMTAFILESMPRTTTNCLSAARRQKMNAWSAMRAIDAQARSNYLRRSRQTSA